MEAFCYDKAMSKLLLILVCGLPGCGKSTIANLLANREGYPVFSIDPIESGILKSGFERTKTTETAAYYIAENLAEYQLSLGNSLIVDSVSASMQQKSHWMKIAEKFGAKLKVIECVCDDQELQMQRINSRNRNIFGIPEISLSGLRKYKGAYSQWKIDHIQLNAVTDVETNYRYAVEYLKSPNSIL